jgi:hypothetical protein
VVDEILDAGGVIPSLPKQLHRIVERRVLIELLGPYHKPHWNTSGTIGQEPR